MVELNPQTVEPRDGLVLVKRYRRPEKLSEHILTNPAWSVDMNRTFWEVVKSTRRADREIGVKLRVDDIVFTDPGRGVFAFRWENEDYFFLGVGQIRSLLRYKTEGIDTKE